MFKIKPQRLVVVIYNFENVLYQQHYIMRCSAFFPDKMFFTILSMVLGKESRFIGKDGPTILAEAAQLVPAKYTRQENKCERLFLW